MLPWKIAVFGLMLGVGMDCTRVGFLGMAKSWGLISAATAIQFIGIPAVVLGVVLWLDVPPIAATGLLLVGTCPSGSISNAYTFLARGNTSFSVTLTTISNVVALIATPVVLTFVASIAGTEIAKALEFPPGPLLQQLFLSMVLPLAIGFFVRARYSEFVLRNLKKIRAGCGILIVLVVTISVCTDPSEIASQLQVLWLPSLLITPFLFALAFAIALAFKVQEGDRVALLFELPCRNVALAMLVALTVMGNSPVAFASLAFFLLEAVLLLALAATVYWKSSRNAST